MRVLVQKFGGSSVADVDKIRRVAERVKATRDAGFSPVIVVSAMGDTTDELLALAKKMSKEPHRRELDMLLTCGERISMALLSMALHDLGVPAISFTGSQSGIITTDSHSQARIVEVRPIRIHDALDQGKVVIVAGYQGVSQKREVTTLGRGGSDTTAVALAAALEAEACEIYSDVDGVFSADPRVVPDAMKLESLSYEEMQELASAGARVLNAQAVEFARQKGITVHAKSTFGTGTGTLIQGAPADDGSTLRTTKVKAVASEKEIAVLTLAPGASLVAWLALLDQSGIRPRLLSSHRSGSAALMFPTQDVHGEDSLRAELAKPQWASSGQLSFETGTVTMVGTGLDADLKTLRTALGTAESQGVRVHSVHTSPLHVTLEVEHAALAGLTKALHGALVHA